MSGVEPRLLDLLRQLERAAHEAGWDAPPVVLAVPHDGAAVPVLMADESAWDNPRQALRMITGALRRQFAAETVAAVILITEAWQVAARPGAEAEAARRAAYRRELHLHPDRETVRLAYLATRPGRLILLTRRQHGDEEPQLTDPARREGDVPAGLLAMLAALPTGN